MSNIDFSVKTMPLGGVRIARVRRSKKHQLQLAVNVALIAAAFLFVTAAVLGLFP